MPTFLIVAIVAVGLAAGKLTTEITAEYVAQYIADQDGDAGLSTRASLAYELDAREPGRPVWDSAVVPVLAMATQGEVAAPAFAEPAPLHRDVQPDVGDALAAPVATGDEVPAGEATAAPGTDAIADVEIDPAQMISLLGDTPHRRADGSVFLPIASQRVFGLRTILGERAEAPVTVELAGRIVPDPSTALLVQSHQDGVIEPPDSRGLPFAGQRVRRGDIVAYLRPVFTTLERAELDARIQELENDIDMARKRMARLEEVMFVRFREGKIEELRVEIAGMQRHLAVVRASLTERVGLRANTDGIVSHVDVAAGQYVTAGTTLLEIVDPARLWVAAVAYSPELADRIEGATAIAADGQQLDLRFVGGGLTLRNQAIPLQFEIVGAPAKLSVDTPVTVVVRTRSQVVAGVKVPRSSLVRTSDGRYMLWERRTAETFVPHHVTTVPVDASSMLVVSDLSHSLRVVTSGIGVLSQVR